MHKFSVEIIDSIQDYVDTMKEIFDFKMLRSFIKSGARLTLNCMNGAGGAYYSLKFYLKLINLNRTVCEEYPLW
jgi:phosphoglucomutase